MFKNIKKIKGVGLYRDFKWDGGIAPLKKHSLFFGFNGTGKTTISRLFSALAEGDEKAFDKGYEVEFSTYDGRTLTINKDEKHENILVYNEDYVDRNFSWQEAVKVGAKAFVVIGQKSKEQEESLSENSKLRDQFKNEMDSLEKEIKLKTKEIGEKSTSHAGEMSKKLTPFGQDKYQKYAKPNIEKDVARLNEHSSEVLLQISEAVELEKLKRQKLSKIYPIPQIGTQSIVDIVTRIKEYLELSRPDKVEMLFDALELEWLEAGVPLHEHKQNCLFCGGILSSERKAEINRIIGNVVAKFISDGGALLAEIENFKLPNQLPLTSSQIYSDLSFELTPIVESYASFLNSLEDWLDEAKMKVQAHKNYLDFDSSFKTQTDSLNNDIRDINSKLRDLAEKHNTRSDEFQKIKNEALSNIELFYLSKYKSEIEQLEKDKASKSILFEAAKLNYRRAKTTVDEIQRSLASEGKAALEINEMLGKFLGRKDIKIEFSEEDSKFILKRNDRIAKKLSEGEKTAISVCYFLISVRANPEAISEKIVVVDDPVTSLDSTNIYNAFAILRTHLKDVKQLMVLTHSLVFFRLIYRWFSKGGDGANQNSYFSVVNTSIGVDRIASIRNLSKNDRDANTEYVLIYRSLLLNPLKM